MIVNEFDEVLAAGWYGYWKEAWNGLDWTIISIVTQHFIIRTSVEETGTTNTWYITVLATGAVLVWLRGMFIVEISEDIGQLLIALKSMVKDVVTFAYLQMILLAGFSFGFWVILNSDTKAGDTDPFGTLRETILVLFQAAMSGDSLIEFENLEFDREVLLQIMSSLYLTFASVVLVNLLIATMGFTYSEVKEESESVFLLLKVSTFIKYDQSLNLLPPPLNVLPILGVLLISPLWCLWWEAASVRRCAYCHMKFPSQNAMRCADKRCSRLRKNVSGVPLVMECISITLQFCVMLPIGIFLIPLTYVAAMVSRAVCPRWSHRVEDNALSGQSTKRGRTRKVLTDKRIKWDEFVSSVPEKRMDKIIHHVMVETQPTDEILSRLAKLTRETQELHRLLHSERQEFRHSVALLRSQSDTT